MVEPNKITSNEQKLCPLLSEGRGVQQKTDERPWFFDNITASARPQDYPHVISKHNLLDTNKTICTSLKRSRRILSVSNSSLTYVIFCPASWTCEIWEMTREDANQSHHSTSLAWKKNGPCPNCVCTKVAQLFAAWKARKTSHEIWKTSGKDLRVKKPGIP